MLYKNIQDWMRSVDHHESDLADPIKHLFDGFTDAPVFILNNVVVEARSRQGRTMQEVINWLTNKRDSHNALFLRAISQTGGRPYRLLLRYAEVPKIRMFLRWGEVQETHLGACSGRAGGVDGVHQRLAGCERTY